MTNTEKARAEQLNAQIKIEINSHKVDIDRSVFVKTKEEKRALKTAKFFSKVVDKTLRNNCITAIVESNPNFGSLKLGIL
jgi:hypothetical protein